MDVEYYLYTDSSTRGWGAHLQELTASGIWSQDQSQLHINVLELQAIWLGLKAFSQRVENAKVALMSDNMSAVAYLRNQGGTKSLAMSDLATDMSVGREEGNDTNSPSPSRTSECVSGPSVPEGSNPQDRMEPKPDHSRQDISCLGQTIRGSVRTKDKHSGGDVMESGQSCPELGRPVRLCVYPPTSLIRACLNKVRTENVEIVLIAPGWPNQEWFPDLRAWRLSKDSTRREDFLKQLPKGSLYLRDNPQRGFTNLSGRCSESGAMLTN